MIWYGQGVQQLHVPRVAGEHGAGRHPGHHLRLHLRPGRAPARGPGGGRGGGGAGADRAARQDQEVRHWQWHSCCSAHFNKMHWQSQKYFITEPNILIIFAIIDKSPDNTMPTLLWSARYICMHRTRNACKSNHRLEYILPRMWMLQLLAGRARGWSRRAPRWTARRSSSRSRGSSGASSAPAGGRRKIYIIHYRMSTMLCKLYFSNINWKVSTVFPSKEFLIPLARPLLPSCNGKHVSW